MNNDKYNVTMFFPTDGIPYCVTIIVTIITTILFTLFILE